MQTSLQVAILAAGEGKRMRSAKPKVLHGLGGRPLLAHVIETVSQLQPRATCVVYRDDAVRHGFPNGSLLWARQDPPRGTGDAVRCALAELPADGVTLVLFGADPLARASTLKKVVEQAGNGSLSLLTAELEDPTGYGRIVRDRNGRVMAIVEQKDATPEQRAIREINTGVMAAPTSRLRGWLERIDKRNASGEYYLTDVAALAVSDGVAIATTRAENAIEAMGVNSMRELAELERRYQRAQAEALLDAGVTLADPARIDLRGTLECGRDVTIDINCIFEGRVTLSDGVCIGANCLIKDSSIGEDTAIAPFSTLDDTQVGARCRIGPYARIRPGTALADE